MKRLIALLVLIAATLNATAAFELSVEIMFPRHVLLTIPVHEDSDFEMRTSFYKGDSVVVTGRFNRITSSNHFYITCGYKCILGNNTSSARNLPVTGRFGERVTAIPNKLPNIQTVPVFTVRKLETSPYTQPPPTNTWTLESPETK